MILLWLHKNIVNKIILPHKIYLFLKKWHNGNNQRIEGAFKIKDESSIGDLPSGLSG